MVKASAKNRALIFQMVYSVKRGRLMVECIDHVEHVDYVESS